MYSMAVCKGLLTTFPQNKQLFLGLLTGFIVPTFFIYTSFYTTHKIKSYLIMKQIPQNKSNMSFCEYIWWDYPWIRKLSRAEKYKPDETVIKASDGDIYSNVLNPSETGSGYPFFETSFKENDNATNEYFIEYDSIANSIKNKVRILCWIMTGPQNHETKAIHVRDTWGKRCNTLLFMSSKNSSILETVALNVSEGRDHLWTKTKLAFQYVYDNHFQDADWFMKADDDTFVVMENLRYMLSHYSSDEKLYFGNKLKKYVKNGYMSGGSGYVLSRKALEAFIVDGLNSYNTICLKTDGKSVSEDVEIGRCLEKLNATAVDTRDALKKDRFFALELDFYFNTKQKELRQKIKDWNKEYAFYPITPMIETIMSSYSCAFHYIDPRMMHLLEFMIYRFKQYGSTAQHTDFEPAVIERNLKARNETVKEECSFNKMFGVRSNCSVELVSIT